MCRIVCVNGDYNGMAISDSDKEKLRPLAEAMCCPKCRSALTLKGNSNVVKKV